jgi:hypothetical protein
MTLSMSGASVPAFVQGLTSLSAVLDKAAAHAEARRIDPAALLQARLFPDMFPLTRQVQIAADFAKGAVARLAGEDPPKWDDTETGFEDLKGRIARTLDFVRGVDPTRIDGSEEREITLNIAGNAMTFRGQPYLVHFALPNFWFHVTAAYSILRHNGVELGKRDFIGRF